MENARNNTIDAAKLLAAFGVVMIHLAPSTSMAELITRIFLSFAVPFFLIIALYFFIGKVCGEDQLNISHLRFDRIIIPYTVWTMVYLILRLIKYRIEHQIHHLDLIPAFFYGGTGVQMYFLPLLLLFQAQALSILLILRRPIKLLMSISVLVGVVIFGYLGSHESYFGFQNCLERGFIYIFFTFLLYCTQSNPFGRRVNLFLGTIIMALTVTTTLTDYHARWLAYVDGPLSGYSIAALSLNSAFITKRKAWQFILTCSYGIYLAHPLFIESFQFAASKLGYEMTPYSVFTKILVSFLITLFCILLIWLIRLNKASAYCLLGEAIHRPG